MNKKEAAEYIGVSREGKNPYRDRFSHAGRTELSRELLHEAVESGKVKEVKEVKLGRIGQL